MEMPGKGVARTESRRDGTLTRRNVEKIQLLSRKVPQEHSLPPRRFTDALRIALRRNHHVLTFRHLPQLVTRNDLIAIERQPKLGLAWNQKRSHRQAMWIVLRKCINHRSRRQCVIHR